MGTIGGFKYVFGNFKVIEKYNKEVLMELTTRVLAEPKNWEDNVSVKISINGTEEWVKCKKKEDNGELIESILAIQNGEEVTFSLSPWANPKTGKTSHYINGATRNIQVNEDMDDGDPGPQDPEREATQMAEEVYKPRDTRAPREPSDMVRCNAMKSSSGTMDVLISEFGGTLKMPEIIKMHQDLMRDGVIPGARYLIENFFI